VSFRARVAATAAALLVVACGDTGASPSPSGAEPGEELPGGATTNVFLFGSNAFSAQAANITPENEGFFFAGNGLFNQPWVQAPSSTEGRDGLGPLFNARSCDACHFRDGRGRPPLEPGEDFIGLLVRLSVPGAGPHGEPLPEPIYGGQAQPFAIAGVPPELTPRLATTESTGTYVDGETYSLAVPLYSMENPAYGAPAGDMMLSPRVAPAMTGLGLLEAIPLARLTELADPDDADGDGISGRINEIWTGTETLPGRFGWKAEKPTVRAQSAGAFAGDIGMTSSLVPADDCTASETECLAAPNGGEPEVSEVILDRVATYSSLLAPPMRASHADPEVLRGKELFAALGCGSCHTPTHDTDPDAALPEVRAQRIRPYTDLLLHDMGEALADNRPTYGASGTEWRTPPLWGLRFYRVVNSHDRLLHDGRARGVAEAILWHGGEAEAAREAFRGATASERAALVTFIESL
jgi:CxxC motif-containing protein (DUF1111 family)